MLQKSETYRFEKDQVYINDIAVLEDLYKSVEAYKAGDYFEAGEYLGKMMKAASVEKVEVNKPALNLGRTDMADLARGILKGTKVGSFNLTALLECIEDVDQEAQIFDGVVHLLKDAIKDESP